MTLGQQNAPPKKSDRKLISTLFYILLFMLFLAVKHLSRVWFSPFPLAFQLSFRFSIFERRRRETCFPYSLPLPEHPSCKRDRSFTTLPVNSVPKRGFLSETAETYPSCQKPIDKTTTIEWQKKKKNAIDVKVFNPYSTLTGNVNSNGYAAVKEFLRGSFFPGYLVSSFRNCVTPRRFVVLCNSTKDKHVVGSSWFILRVLKLVVILLLKFRFMSPNVCCWHARWNNISSSTLRTWKARGIYMDL